MATATTGTAAAEELSGRPGASQRQPTAGTPTKTHAAGDNGFGAHAHAASAAGPAASNGAHAAPSGSGAGPAESTQAGSDVQVPRPPSAAALAVELSGGFEEYEASPNVSGKSRKENAARKEYALEAAKRHRSSNAPRMYVGSAAGAGDAENPPGAAEKEAERAGFTGPTATARWRASSVASEANGQRRASDSSSASGGAASPFRSIKAMIIVPIAVLLLVSNLITWYLGYQAVQTSISEIVGILEKDLLSKTADGARSFLDVVTPALVDLQAMYRSGLLTTSRSDPNTHPWAFRMLEAWPQFAVCGAGYEDDWYWSMTLDNSDAKNLRILHLRVLYDAAGLPVLTSFPTDRTGVPIGNTSNLNDPSVARRSFNFRARERIWYRQARASAAVGGRTAVWSPSYFKTEGQLSMAVAIPLLSQAGALLGVGHCVVELEAGLSPIIQGIVAAYESNTVAFIVEGGTPDYMVASSVGSVVQPNPNFTSTSNTLQNGVLQMSDIRLSVWEARGPLPAIARCLRDRFGPLTSIGAGNGTGAGPGAGEGQQVSMTCEVAGLGSAVILGTRMRHRGVNWLLVVTVSSDKYLQNSRRSSVLTGIISGVIFVVAISVSVLSALAISRPLQRLATEMELVRTLIFSDGPAAAGSSIRGGRGQFLGSRVSEVQRLSSAFSRMFQGLRVFAKFVPPSVVHKAIAARSAEHATELSLTPIRSTLFFVDIRNFTTLSAALPPDKLLDVMGDALSMMSSSIESNKGTIDKFIGDAIMAFFNHPLTAVEDHEERACEAALQCQESLMAMRALWVARGLPPLECRIGINTGDCLIGNFGCESRFSYTAVGDAVNAAARLEPLNKRYGTTILISEAVAERVRDKFFVRIVDAVVLKGRRAGCRIYELVARLGTESEAERQYAARYEAAFALFLARRFEEAAGRLEECGRLAAAVQVERELFELELEDAAAEGNVSSHTVRTARSYRSGLRSARGGTALHSLQPGAEHWERRDSRSFRSCPFPGLAIPRAGSQRRPAAVHPTTPAGGAGAGSLSPPVSATSLLLEPTPEGPAGTLPPIPLPLPLAALHGHAHPNSRSVSLRLSDAATSGADGASERAPPTVAGHSHGHGHGPGQGAGRGPRRASLDVYARLQSLHEAGEEALPARVLERLRAARRARAIALGLWSPAAAAEGGGGAGAAGFPALVAEDVSWRVLKGKALRYSAHPPPDAWDGAEDLDSKFD